MRNAVIFEARRDGYGIDQIANRAMTVGELMGILEDYEEDTLVIISHDNGYTYGSVSFTCEAVEDEDGEWDKQEW